MRRHKTTQLTLDEARGVMLAAQGLLDAPPPAPGVPELRATIERLGVVQVDTISVVERSQYLVLWSRLGVYEAALLDSLLHPHRAILECWCHVASIVPMSDYAYHHARTRGATDHLWGGDRTWMTEHPEALEHTLQLIRERGPLASADFERLSEDRRADPWDWYGGKESRRALQILWTLGDLMVHSRRGGQKVYDVPERVLGEAIPRDEALPGPEERLRHFVHRTALALGIVTPSWLCDYFRLATRDGLNGSRRAVAATLLAGEVAHGTLVPAAVAGLPEPAYIARERLVDLARLRTGETPARTTLLSPFDSLIWDRGRTRALWNYEVSFEAYVVPEKRRYGYYCLAILHQGRLVGRLDSKMHRAERRLDVRAVYLEPEIAADEALLDGLAGALGDLGRFLGADAVTVERSEPPALAERLTPPAPSAIRARKAAGATRRAQAAGLADRT